MTRSSTPATPAVGLAPLASVAGLGNLPALLSSFVGRGQALLDVQQLLSSARLVTLTGAGGVGKSRLALGVAASAVHAYPDGVWLSLLAPLGDPGLVTQAVAGALGISERGGQPLLAALLESLCERRALLVLDNCEHLIQACAELVEALLAGCSRLTILATSREPLAVAGEVTWRVPSLRLPPLPLPPPEQLTQYEAVRLFVERAVAARPDFHVTNANAPAVAEVCWRLDGIPLAIELASAWVRTLTVDQLAARLDDRLGLLVGGNRTALPRHQTLRGAIEWSYGLLSEPERWLFAALSVFAGGWTLEAAEAVCAREDVPTSDILGLLRQLVDKSLVLVDELPEGTRYRLLETLRAYGRERLQATGELSTLVQRRHSEWYLGIAEAARPLDLDATHIDRLYQEQDNLRAALQWCIDEGDAEVGVRLGVAVWPLWYVRGLYTEGRAWLDRLLALGHGMLPSSPFVRALTHAGHLAYCQGDFTAAGPLLEEALSTARELADEHELAVTLTMHGNLARAQGDAVRAREHYAAALALHRRVSDPAWTAVTVGSLGGLAEEEGDHETAQAYASESFALWKRLGNAWGTARSGEVLARVAASRGDRATVETYLAEVLRLEHQLGDHQGLVLSLLTLANNEQAKGDVARAGSVLTEAVSVAREAGDRLGLTRCMRAIAGLVSAQQPERAVSLVGAAEMLRSTVGADLAAAERERFASWEASARRILGDEAYAAAFAEGRGYTLEQAIAAALELASAAGTQAGQPLRPASSAVGLLTRREREVAALLAQGLTDRQIAERLVITEGTAGVHVAHILAKLDFHSRAQVAAWAVAQGLHSTSGD